MSDRIIPDPDCRDKALVRRSNVYIARQRSHDGIIDAEPVPHDADAREFASGDSAARETPRTPTPVPARIRRQSQVEVAPIDPPLSTPQTRPHQESAGFMNQFADFLVDEYINPDSPAEHPDQTAAKGPRIINVSFVQDRLGLHMHLFISRGARSMLLSVIALIILLAMGKLADALELLARFIF